MSSDRAEVLRIMTKLRDGDYDVAEVTEDLRDLRRLNEELKKEAAA